MKLRFKIALLKVLIFSVAAIVLYSDSNADDKDIEKLYTERTIDCGDIAKNSSRLIPVFYGKGRRDSAWIILNYWAKECGETPSVVRARWLMAIDSGIFYDSLLTFVAMPVLANFRWNRLYNGFDLPVRRQYISASIDSLLHAIADSNSIRKRSETTQSLLSLFYSSRKGSTDSLFLKLQTEEHRNTPLGIAYYDYATAVRESGGQYVSIIAGGWVPVGKRRHVGNHPEVGFAAGMFGNRHFAELEFSAAVGDSKRDYVVRKDDSLVTTNDFTTWRILGILGRQVQRRVKDEFDILMGVGIQGLTAIYAGDSDKEKARMLHSVVGVAGAQYKRYLRSYSDSYLALQARWEMSKMNTDGGTDLTGSAFVLRLIFGFSWADQNPDRNNELRLLQYQYKD
jgi:hypothetical protein